MGRLALNSESRKRARLPCQISFSGYLATRLPLPPGGVYRDADNLGLASWGTVKSIFNAGGSSDFRLPAGLNVDVALIHASRYTLVGLEVNGPSGYYGNVYGAVGRGTNHWEAETSPQGIYNIYNDFAR